MRTYSNVHDNVQQIDFNMKKKRYTVRLPEDVLETVKERADEDGVTVTEVFENALRAYLGFTDSEDSTLSLLERVEALEANMEALQSKGTSSRVSKPRGTKSTKPKSNPDDFPELLTVQQIHELTGYAKATLRSKLSRKGVRAVEQIRGNRGGLYSKSEVLERIGTK
jgi:hypothetical protein